LLRGDNYDDWFGLPAAEARWPPCNPWGYHSPAWGLHSSQDIGERATELVIISARLISSTFPQSIGQSFARISAFWLLHRQHAREVVRYSVLVPFLPRPTHPAISLNLRHLYSYHILHRN
jgi:hypothetical protein